MGDSAWWESGPRAGVAQVNVCEVRGAGKPRLETVKTYKWWRKSSLQFWGAALWCCNRSLRPGVKTPGFNACFCQQCDSGRMTFLFWDKISSSFKRRSRHIRWSLRYTTRFRLICFITQEKCRVGVIAWLVESLPNMYKVPGLISGTA